VFVAAVEDVRGARQRERASAFTEAILGALQVPLLLVLKFVAGFIASFNRLTAAAVTVAQLVLKGVSERKGYIRL
jgi:hypothetical protein